jgi:hypothetical protein
VRLKLTGASKLPLQALNITLSIVLIATWILFTWQKHFLWRWLIAFVEILDQHWQIKEFVL